MGERGHARLAIAMVAEWPRLRSRLGAEPDQRGPSGIAQLLVPQRFLQFLTPY